MEGCASPSRGGLSTRRGFWLVALAGVALLVATGCMRLDVDLVVHGPDEASVKGRVTVSPALLGMMGGVEGLEEGFKEDLDPSVEAEIESVSDSDGWQGIAYKMRGPHDVVMGGDLEDAKIEQTDSGWRFSWKGEPFSEIPSGEGFRFKLSVSLPGGASSTPTARAPRWAAE